MALVVYYVPLMSYSGQSMTATDRAAAEGSLRTSLVQSIVGLAVLGGLYFTARNLTLSRSGQITERFSKAIEQLGSPDINIRIGAIYALEQISRDSRQLAATVLEILIRFTSGKAGRSDDSAATHEHTGQQPASADLEVALKVIGRRPYSNHETERLKLAMLALCNFYLIGADFRHADFAYSLLCGTNFARADLRSAFFGMSCMQRVFLTEANARGATFGRTDLRYSFLRGVNFDNADLTGADLRRAVVGSRAKVWTRPASFHNTRLHGARLEGAELIGVDLRHVVGLTQEQVNSAVVDDTAQLPTGINLPANVARQ